MMNSPREPQTERTGRPPQATRSHSSPSAATTAADTANATSGVGQGANTRPGFTAGFWLGAKDLGRVLWPLVGVEARAVIAEKVQAAEGRLPQEAEQEQPDNTVVQLRRRREASLRCPPLQSGVRDPLSDRRGGE